MTDEPTLLSGRYELAGLLGRGGMAEVRQARDRRLGREVAVKQLRVDLATDPTFQLRFRREAQAAAGLNHPNIVAVYDTGEQADPATGVMVPFIVMELVEGHTLREILRTGRQIQPAKALGFTQGVLDALSYSHKAGIVHRDIKPANVMLTENGTVKVMDFGIARAVADTSATMTQTAAVIGTAQYLSPEQARGETVDSRSDIYSAGCLLYELLVGRPPFQGDSPVSVAYQHVREQPVPPSHLDPMVTPSMDAVVLKALAKDPADRYQTAAAMRNDIGRLLAGQDIAAFIPPPPVPVPAAAAAPTVVAASPSALSDTATQTGTAVRAIEPVRKRRTGLWVALLTVLAVASAIGLFVLFNPPNQVEMVTVPSVFDLRDDVAVTTLTDAGLVPAVNPVRGPAGNSVGRVTRQSLVAGTSWPKGTAITIDVNLGPETRTIPLGLKGRKYESVVSELNQLGFPNVTPLPDPNEPLTAKANEVTSVNPAEGSPDVTLDTQITVYYALGESQVPNLFGLDETNARFQAKSNGFPNVKVGGYEESTQTPGTVLSQSPTVGEIVKRTKAIVIILAKAPAPPTTPTPSESTPEESDPEETP
jgi:serine/threonine-protein kinase